MNRMTAISPGAEAADPAALVTRLAEAARLAQRTRAAMPSAARAAALHGFVKCADGRLYHPVVAEKAIAAFENLLKIK